MCAFTEWACGISRDAGFAPGCCSLLLPALLREHFSCLTAQKDITVAAAASQARLSALRSPAVAGRTPLTASWLLVRRVHRLSRIALIAVDGNRAQKYPLPGKAVLERL